MAIIPLAPLSGLKLINSSKNYGPSHSSIKSKIFSKEKPSAKKGCYRFPIANLNWTWSIRAKISGSSFKFGLN